MSEHVDVAVVGGGPVGLTVALFDELRATAADPAATRAHLRASAMLTHRLQEA